MATPPQPLPVSARPLYSLGTGLGKPSQSQLPFHGSTSVSSGNKLAPVFRVFRCRLPSTLPRPAQTQPRAPAGDQRAWGTEQPALFSAFSRDSWLCCLAVPSASTRGFTATGNVPLLLPSSSPRAFNTLPISELQTPSSLA